MSGDMPPLPNTPSWRDAQLKKGTGTNLPFMLPPTLAVRSSEMLVSYHNTTRRHKRPQLESSPP
jgi:hypothetical protein